MGITKPHPNWWVPSQYFDRYDPAEIRAALELSLRTARSSRATASTSTSPRWPSPTPRHRAANLDLWTDYIHAYLASVSYADAKVGQVLDALEDDPQLAANTAILLWSDNGYHLGDKDSVGQVHPRGGSRRRSR